MTNKLKSLGSKILEIIMKLFMKKDKSLISIQFLDWQNIIYRQDKNNLIKNLLNKRETSDTKYHYALH